MTRITDNIVLKKYYDELITYIKINNVPYKCNACGRFHRINTGIWTNHLTIKNLDDEGIPTDTKKRCMKIAKHRFYIKLKKGKITFPEYYNVGTAKDDYGEKMISIHIPIEDPYGIQVLGKTSERMYYYPKEIVSSDVKEVNDLLKKLK